MKIDRWVITGGRMEKSDCGAWVLADDVRMLFSPPRGGYRHEECDAVQEGCLNMHHHGHKCRGSCELVDAESFARKIRRAP